MIARMIETFNGYPQVELVPDGYNLDHWTGRIYVTPLHLDVDAGKYTLSPQVEANVKLGNMTAKSAEEWGDILRAASLIANRQNVPWFSESVADAYLNMWRRVDELMK